jgi:hypothetical protein
MKNFDARVRAKNSNRPADQIAARTAAEAIREKLVDQAVEDTFPASDPPSYMGGATVGAPQSEAPEREEAKKGRDPHRR